MDVWSLFVTILAVNPRFAYPPPDAQVYDDILRAVRAAAVDIPTLNTMVRENPTHRASAAQLLVAHFDGRGLTTPRVKIPPISSEEEGVATGRDVAM